MKKLYTATIVALLCAPLAMAEEQDGSFVDAVLEKLGASETVDETKLIDWGVLPGPFVNPEQGLGVGIAAAGFYTPFYWKRPDPYSTITVTAFASTTGSYGFGFNNRTYLLSDTLRLLGEAWITQTPKYYWGIGTSKAKNENKKVLYQGLRLEIDPKIAYQILPDTYLKMGWRWQSFDQVKGVDGAKLPAEMVDAASSGALFGFEYDSRDFEPNPTGGQFLDVEWVINRKSLGSDNHYDNLLLNYRIYQPVSRVTLIAAEVYSQSVFGDAPWYDYSQLGDDERMRGYYSGQYRDNHFLATQVEIRHTLEGRHGVVAWVGAGNVAKDYRQLFDTTWLPTLGLGYRFAFKARINIRLDLGFGKESMGFYFQVNEAF